MPNNKSINTTISISTTITPNNNEKEIITQVLVMVLKSFKMFFNGSAMI